MFSPTTVKRGFTLLELLVVIVIIGILATLSTVALSAIRAKARDAKRIADIKQVQTALELYFSDENTYPSTLAFGTPFIGPSNNRTYMAKLPNNPTPRAEGACTADSDYSYTQGGNGNSYMINYCLAKSVNNLVAGPAYATQKAIHNTTSTQATPTTGLACPSESTVSYNGVIYNTVWLDYNSNGSEDAGECWFKENLATNKKPNGTALIKNTDFRCVGNASNNEDCASVPADNSGNNLGTASTLGFLYTWSAAMNLAGSCNTTDCSGSITANHQGICPSGWHIPSDNGTVSSDFAKLINYAENKAVPTTGSTCGNNTDCPHATKVLREAGTAWWNSAHTANNELGLTLRGVGGFFVYWFNRGDSISLWSANQASNSSGVVRDFYVSDETVYRYSYDKTSLFSIRCVKN